MMNEERFVHYKIGHDQLDQDHWKLFKLMDDVIVDIRAKDYQSALNKIPHMNKALKDHFKHECEFMKSVAYPYKGSHSNDHEKIQDILINLEQALPKFKSNTSLITEFPISNIEDLFVKHVDNYDRQFINYITQNGK
jgi:hemerythrin-like metal-binding protein